jgi:hypothetical protein
MMGTPDRAAAILTRYRAGIERRIEWYERLCPDEIDWPPVVWDAAYRAAFRCDVPEAFWRLFKKILWRRAVHPLARHARRRAKLRRQPAEALDTVPW